MAAVAPVKTATIVEKCILKDMRDVQRIFVSRAREVDVNW